MFQRGLYPFLVLAVLLVSFNIVRAETLLFQQSFDSPIRTSSWSDDGSLLAISTQTAIYMLDIHSHDSRQLSAFTLQEDNSAASEIIWSSDGTKLAIIGQDATDYSLGYLMIIDVQSDTLLYSGRTAMANSLSFSPDNNRVALTYSRYMGGQAYYSQLEILDFASNSRTNWELGGYMGAVATRLVWKPDATQLAIQIGGKVHVYALETMDEIISFQVDPYNFYDIAWSSDGSEIVTYNYNNLRRWNALTGEIISSFDAGIPVVDSYHAYVAWLPNNTLVVTGVTRANVLDAQTGNLLYYYELSTDLAYWSPHGQFAALIELEQLSLYILEAIPAPAQESFAITIEAQPRSSETAMIGGLAHWSPQGEILLTNNSSMTNLSQIAAPIYSITVANAQIDKTLFSRDGRIVALGLRDSASLHYEIQVWDVQQNLMLHQLRGHRGLISALEFNADNSLLASGSSDTTIRVWDLNTGEELSALWGHFGRIADIAFSPDSRLLASVGDETMRLWDTQTGEQLERVDPYTDYVIGGHYTFSVSFSHDGRHIVYRDRTYDEMQGGIVVRTWDFETEPQSYFTEQIISLSDFLYSTNGEFFALTNLYADVKLFERQSNTEIELPYGICVANSMVLDEFRNHWYDSNPYDDSIEVLGDITEAHWLDFSPDSQLIAKSVLMACLPEALALDTTEEMFEYNTIWLMDTETGAIQAILRGNDSPAYRMFFSPDGSQLLTQHLDGAIKLWNVETGEEVPITGL